ncbi:hypothetical protein G8C92_20720 [Paenibacillus donghaensis]|uniref:hypothetical protein n=1 Tax=Paenibacillus donghaensis TaxID=414771 RepID=UPI001883C612|nr:hypothetical protein [Paenibacillus donghaensis]MBE9916445.1 hypothetical protein [Paenibacillus donghaensis]
MPFNNKDYEESIIWFDEDKQFDTIQEAHEWVYSGAYNEIGYIYDGYRSKDPKLAYALLFELIRLNTIHEYRHDVHCDNEYKDGTMIYKVWVKNKRYEFN